MSRSRRNRPLAGCLILLSFGLAASHLPAQISLTAAVDLALRNSPRIALAQSDVAKALATLQQTRDVYIPSLSVGGSGYGRSSGYPLGQPTVLDVNSQSLVFSFSQRDYIRSARAGLDAANLALTETRQAVVEDTALTCIALDHDAAREAALREQESFAGKLVTIVQDRLDAGQDTAIDLTGSRLTAAQIRLRRIQAEADTAVDRAHLAHLVGLPAEGLSVGADSIPAPPAPPPLTSMAESALTPGIQAAFATAHSRREQAFGDARYLFRPQISFAAQYSRLSTYNNPQYLEYFGRRDQFGNLLPFPSNSVGAGVQVSVPILDYAHRARARASAADAVHAERDAAQQRDQFLEGRLRNQRSIAALSARAEVAELDHQLAEQQGEVLKIQLQHPAPNGVPFTPKDEQRSRIDEREKYLTLLDARFQLRQAEVNLLRQTGQLEPWLKSVVEPQSTPPAVRIQP